MKEQSKMKKLMIAAAIVCAAAVSQAASVTWGETETPIAHGWLIPDDTPNFLADGTKVYLMFSDALTGYDTRDSIIKAFATAGSGYESTLAGSAAGQGSFDMDNYVKTMIAKDVTVDGNKGYGYMVIFDGGEMYVSELKNSNYTPLDQSYKLEFGAQMEYALAGAKEAKLGFQGEGWYKAEAVPEPTSGLLLLLGVAGLALRRRRA